VKKTLAAAAIASLAGLTACTSNPASPSTHTATPSESAATGQASPSESPAATAATSGIKDACELFNSLYAQYKAVPANDPNGYEDIYLKSQDAKDAASGDLTGLFSALSVLAIDHAKASENSGGPEQASKDAVRDAVFANAGTCTAEGVTLRL
jgi:hypothetical protein